MIRREGGETNALVAWNEKEIRPRSVRIPPGESDSSQRGPCWAVRSRQPQHCAGMRAWDTCDCQQLGGSLFSLGFRRGQHDGGWVGVCVRFWGDPAEREDFGEMEEAVGI